MNICIQYLIGNEHMRRKRKRDTGTYRPRKRRRPEEKNCGFCAEYVWKRKIEEYPEKCIWAFPSSLTCYEKRLWGTNAGFFEMYTFIY